MSVSTLDPSVPASSTLGTSLPAPQGKANRPAPAAPSFDGQNAANVSFHTRENPAGPVFGDHHDRKHDHDPMAQTMPLPRFIERFKQWLSQWFGGCRPPACPPCNSAPPRPHPTIGRPQPKPDYAMQSREQLTRALLDNFTAFTGATHGKYMTLGDIKAMANRQPGNDPVMNNTIRLAKELLNRPDLMQALDRNGDGKLSQWEIQRISR